MKLFPSVNEFFSLDIGTTSVRVVQLRKSGETWNLLKFGVAPIDIRVATSDAPEDQRRLGEIITNLVSQSGINTRNVVLGLPSTKTFITVVDLPDMPQQELSSTVKYQAEQYIPMPIDEVKLDWANLGKSIVDNTKIEVLLASVSKKFSESRLDLVESLGLNVVAIEPDALALARSLTPPTSKDAKLIIDFGDFASDIVLVLAGAPRLVRSIPMGMQTLIKAASQNLNVDPSQAAQFILKFGLFPDRLEGQVLKALDSTLDQFSAEIIKSAKFFVSRYPSIPISSVILSGYAQSIPAFDQYISSKTNMKAAPGNPWGNVHYSNSQSEALQQVASQFSVAVGLAERTI